MVNPVWMAKNCMQSCGICDGSMGMYLCCMFCFDNITRGGLFEI